MWSQASVSLLRLEFTNPEGITDLRCRNSPRFPNVTDDPDTPEAFKDLSAPDNRLLKGGSGWKFWETVGMRSPVLLASPEFGRQSLGGQAFRSRSPDPSGSKQMNGHKQSQEEVCPAETICNSLSLLCNGLSAGGGACSSLRTHFHCDGP